MKHIGTILIAAVFAVSVSVARAEEPAAEAAAIDEAQLEEAESMHMETEAVPDVEPVPAEPSAPRPWERSDYSIDGAEVQLEAAVAFDYILPGNSDWDSAMGAEIKLRFWGWESWGVAAGFGQAEWSFSDGPVDVGDTPFSSPTAEGDATVYPLTVAGSYRWDLDNGLQLVADAGLRYLIVDSEIGVVVSYVDHAQRNVHYATFVRNEDKFMGVLALELRGPIAESGLWMVGAEYQLEVGSSDPNWLMEDVGNDFDGLVARVGAGLTW